MQSDYLVIGSGIGGLSFALQVAKADRHAHIVILSKSNLLESNTRHAQGGIAVVFDQQDTFESHIADTLKAGAGHCDPDIVQMVVTEAPNRLAELHEWGVDFDRNNSGRFALGLEGGHSANRILHHKDQSGLEIARKLIEQVEAQPNISVYSGLMVLELLKSDTVFGSTQKCQGALVLDVKTQTTSLFHSKVTVLATGGAGQVYQHTTNPAIATGDGMALAKRAGCTLADMEFVQFHPTALYEPGKRPMFLISEAVRGNGAILRNVRGERFMHTYDERLELASRDIVSRAIHQEMIATGADHVYLDCRHLDPGAFKSKFEAITAYLAEKGIDPAVELIPVVPAAHYMCGGIKVDSWGRTEMEGLLAVGECARTGLHGANRLASNSLLEAVVFAQRAACIAPVVGDENVQPELPRVEIAMGGYSVAKAQIILLQQRLQALMSRHVGISRNDENLAGAKAQLQELAFTAERWYALGRPTPELAELRNMITVALEIVQQSQQRQHSLGAFHKEMALVEA